MLRHLYDFAKSPDLIKDPAFEDPAFANKRIRWIIDLDVEGKLIGYGPCRTDDNKEFSCPKTTGSKNAGGIAEFLADGLTSVFGLDLEPEKPMSPKERAKNKDNNEKKYKDFWGKIDKAEQSTGHVGLKALQKFHDAQMKSGAPPSFLQWEKPNKKGKDCWMIRTAGGTKERLGSENFTFRVDGELLLDNGQIRRFWRDAHADKKEQTYKVSDKGLCLVSGLAEQPLATTHELKIKGVPNTASWGASIVSFDKPAFTSYGFEQSLNAPTSIDSATAYCTALNWLLKHDDHSIKIGQTVLCFWTKSESNSSNFIASLLTLADPQSIGQFIKSPWAGIERDLARRDQFFAVTLAGNSGRIVVRGWLQQPLDDAITNLQKWFVDLKLCVPPRQKSKYKQNKLFPLAIFRLACTTVHDSKNLQPNVSYQLYRAAIEGIAPPISLLTPILNQLHSKLVSGKDYDLLHDESRFALLKLIINRNRKETDMELKSELTADTKDPAYNCGRLLAIFDNLQRRAHNSKLEGATIAERYFPSASTAPMSAFGILWKLHFHHLRKLSQLGKKGLAVVVQRKIGEICSRFEQTDQMRQKNLPPEFPRILDLQAQGRFALGYYQQRAADYANHNQQRDKRDVFESDSEFELNSNS